jgi:predicted lipid-binding transport protein (Tim44 family)
VNSPKTVRAEVNMSSSLIQLLVLAGVAIFLILKLRSVLGTREGFEKPPLPIEEARARPVRRDFEVIEGGPDRDIVDHVADGSSAAKALAAMKAAEPAFSVSDFLAGARGAYEMILMAFEKGDLASIRPFLSDDVFATFSEVVEAREREGLTIESTFVGLRELSLQDATFDSTTREGEITVRFLGELTSVVRNRAGEVVEGSPTAIKRQRDQWSFARRMGVDDPNWQLVATGE